MTSLPNPNPNPTSLPKVTLGGGVSNWGCSSHSQPRQSPLPTPRLTSSAASELAIQKPTSLQLVARTSGLRTKTSRSSTRPAAHSWFGTKHAARTSSRCITSYRSWDIAASIPRQHCSSDATTGPACAKTSDASSAPALCVLQTRIARPQLGLLDCSSRSRTPTRGSRYSPWTSCRICPKRAPAMTLSSPSRTAPPASSSSSPRPRKSTQLIPRRCFASTYSALVGVCRSRSSPTAIRDSSRDFGKRCNVSSALDPR